MTDRFKTVYSKGNNFVINNNNNKIGINKASPEESLDVSGNIKFSGEIIGNINYNNLTNKPTTLLLQCKRMIFRLIKQNYKI